MFNPTFLSTQCSYARTVAERHSENRRELNWCVWQGVREIMSGRRLVKI